MSARAEAVAVMEEANGKGSYGDPYKKRDGTKMVKLNLSVPIEFARELKQFCAQRLEPTSSFVVRAVLKEIEGHKR